MRTRRLMLIGPSRSSSSSSSENVPPKGKPEPLSSTVISSRWLRARRGDRHARGSGVLLNIVQRLAHDLEKLQRDLGRGRIVKLPGDVKVAKMPVSRWKESTMRLSDALRLMPSSAGRMLRTKLRRSATWDRHRS